MPLELEPVPFLDKRRMKELDGVYKSTICDDIAVMKNVYRRGYIKEDENGHGKAYDAISVSFNSVKHGKIKRYMVNMDEWQRILDL